MKWWRHYYTLTSNMSDDESQLLLRTANKDTFIYKHLNVGAWLMETASLFYWNPTILYSWVLDLSRILGACYSESHNLGKIIPMDDFWHQWKQTDRVSCHACQTEQPRKVWQFAYGTGLWRCYSPGVTAKSQVTQYVQTTW